MKKFQLRVVVVVELRYSEIFGRTKFENLDFFERSRMLIKHDWSEPHPLESSLSNHFANFLLDNKRLSSPTTRS